MSSTDKSNPKSQAARQRAASQPAGAAAAHGATDAPAEPAAKAASPAAESAVNGAGREQGVLYLGIDLGTSRTTVSASNGVRESIASYVGYPRDVVSRKLLKREKLFGEEAIAKRLALDLYRPLGNGVIKG